jgi:hypothetical protein
MTGVINICVIVQLPGGALRGAAGSRSGLAVADRAAAALIARPRRTSGAPVSAS